MLDILRPAIRWCWELTCCLGCTLELPTLPYVALTSVLQRLAGSWFCGPMILNTQDGTDKMKKFLQIWYESLDFLCQICQAGSKADPVWIFTRSSCSTKEQGLTPRNTGIDISYMEQEQSRGESGRSHGCVKARTDQSLKKNSSYCVRRVSKERLSPIFKGFFFFQTDGNSAYLSNKHNQNVWAEV